MNTQAPAAPPAALRLQELRKQFGRTQVLRGLSLDVPAGQRLALIGPNGAGKSTLFDLISGRQRPSGGSVWLQGRRIDGLPPHRISRLGLARSFQITQVFGRLSVLDNLRCALLWRLGYRYNFWRPLARLADVAREADTLLAHIRLSHKRHTLAQHLGYAEQRALELGLTLASGAPVLLLDEPTAGMSASETRHFTALIHRLTAGKTLLVVEHDMSVVFDLAERIAVLAQGRLLALGTPAQVRADPRVRQAYLGHDRAAAASPLAAASPDSPA